MGIFDGHGLFYPVQWNTIKGLDTLETKKNALSCIYHSEEILNLVKTVLNNFSLSSSFENYFENLRRAYYSQKAALFNKYKNNNLKSIITNSTRFNWNGNTLTSKINRFGHAMDPDRGVLYFTNMLNGVENCITEIQVNRPDDIKARGGYGSLFDVTAHEDQLLKYVSNIIKTKRNIFTQADALYVFQTALNISNYNIFE